MSIIHGTNPDKQTAFFELVYYEKIEDQEFIQKSKSHYLDTMQKIKSKKNGHHGRHNLVPRNEQRFHTNPSFRHPDYANPNFEEILTLRKMIMRLEVLLRSKKVL
ncbi:MAG: hypothetical protein HamCj_21520 [Candidatus Hamiltonella defensa (Ceratovacuna japonica)]